MTQKVRKRWLSPEQINKLSRDKKLEHREFMRQFREKTLRELATNYTLTQDEKINLLVDYTVGVPLE